MPRLATSFAALGAPVFRWLWIGQTLSRLGDEMFFFGLVWMVVEFRPEGSAAAMSVLMLAADVPMIAFTLLGGVLADRWPRRRTMLVIELLRGLIMAGLGLVAAQGRLALWHLYALTVVLGVVEAGFVPAYRALYAELLPPHLLGSANALTRFSGTACQLVGAVLGSLAVRHWGATSLFWLNAASFGIAAVTLLGVPSPGSSGVAREAEESLLTMARAGFHYVRSVPWLQVLTAIWAGHHLVLAAPMITVVPALVREKLGPSPEALAAVTTAMHLGGLAGSLVAGELRWLRPFQALLGSLLAATGAVALLAAPVSGWPGWATAIAGALAWGIRFIAIVLTDTFIQQHVPEYMLGRVFGLMQFLSFSVLPVGYLVSGSVAGRTGASLYLMGAAATAAFLLTLVSLWAAALRAADLHRKDG